MSVRARERARERGGGRVVATVLLLLGVPLPSAAASLDGAVRLTWTETDLETSQVSNADRSANLSLTQSLAPYLALRFFGTYGDQTTEIDGAETGSRTVVQPRVELLYSRPGLSWKLGWENRSIDSLTPTEELESSAIVSSLSWHPRSDLHLNLGYREATNEADVAALGRDLDERRASLDAVYQRRYWSLGYAASYSELEGGAASLYVEQLRQDLRLQATRSWADGRLRLAVGGTAGRVDAEQRRADGDLGEPLPVLVGLFAVDPSPAIGELEAAAGLVDGDLASVTTPPIDIGGANLFRNIGVDLGLPLPATRLEIAVDRPSDRQLAWEVYSSFDGLIWDPVTVVAREFDAALLLYRLRFPQTTTRYLKAVNVASNSVADVRVTEIRALRELGEIGEPERSSEVYRVGASLGWRVSPRVDFDAGADLSNDTATVGGIVRSDQRASGLRAGLQFDLPREFTLALRMRRTEYDEGREGGLTRTTDDLAASLRWNPLPTVDAMLTTGVRTDSDETGELTNLESMRLTVSLDLIEELQLVSTAGISRLDGAAVGAARETQSWTQRLEMRPRRNLRLDTGYTWTRTESGVTEGVLLDRTSAFLGFDWSPGSVLTLRGTLDYSDSGSGSTLRQSYGLFWAPGPKLSVSLAWDQSEQQGGLLTSSDSASLNYQLAPRMLLFASVSRSRAVADDGSESEFTSAHAGTSLSF